MANVFTKTDLDLSKPLNPQQGLVMLASFPKSGNTWTRLFFYALNTRSKEIDLDHFATTASTMDAQKAHFAAVLGQNPNELSYKEIAETVTQVQKYLALRRPNRELIKTHTSNSQWDGVKTMNFAAIRSVIYIIRNPLDVVASYAAHMNLSIDKSIKALGTLDNWLCAPTKEQQDKVGQVPQLMGSWSEHVVSWTGKPDPRLTFVRYEDLKEDSVTHFKRMVDALGVRKSRLEVAKAVEKTDFAQIQKKEQNTGFKENVHGDQQFFRSGKTGGWREELNDDQVKQVIRDHAFQMNRFGYIPVEYHEFAKEVIADSQTAQHFLNLAKKTNAAGKKNIRRRIKSGQNRSSSNATAPRVGVMFPSVIKAPSPTGQ